EYTPHAGQLKARRFAVSRAQVKQGKPDRSENQIRRPGREPGRNMITFTERQKKVGKQIGVEKYEHNSGGNAAQNSAARVTDPERRRDKDHHQTSPWQGKAILQMGAERCEQRRRKIGIKMKILPQLRKAEVFRADIGAAQAKRCLAPIVDLERRIHFLVGDVSGGIVLDDFYLLELPSFCFEMISRARSEIIRNDIVPRVLLQHLHIIENVVSRTKTLDEPRPCIGPIAKNLALNRELMGSGSRNEIFLGHLGMRRERIVECESGPHR